MSKLGDIARDAATDFGAFLLKAVPDLYELYKRSGGDADKALDLLKAAYLAEVKAIDDALDAKYPKAPTPETVSVVLDADSGILRRVTSPWARRGK